MPPIYNWDVVTDTYGAYRDKFRDQGWIVVPGHWPQKTTHPRLLLTPVQAFTWRHQDRLEHAIFKLVLNKANVSASAFQRAYDQLFVGSEVHSAAYEAVLVTFEATWGIRKMDRSGKYSINNLENQR